VLLVISFEILWGMNDLKIRQLERYATWG
jgi:hypothetical protein